MSDWFLGTTIRKQDIHRVLTRTPKDIREMLKENPSMCIGGGFIRAIISGETPNDIDIFGRSTVELQVAAKSLQEKREEFGETIRGFSTGNAITILTQGRMPIQFITRWVYPHPRDVLWSFDFTVCQAVIYYCADSKTFKGLCAETFYQDLAAKRLVYTYPKRSEDAGGSLLRVIKYVRRGYNVQVDTLAGVCARLQSGIEYRDNEDYWNEEWRAGIMTGLLREVDPLLIIDGCEIGEDHHRPDRDH